MVAELGPIRHKASADWQGDYASGTDPGRRDYASFTEFADPDGNTWTIQERGYAAQSQGASAKARSRS
ncbi:hypothetical protein LWP59_22940 [Amycolatopsis acidiphila]|uniref:VOC domain-containing protein n=1 Tax=Amycolatopsis acidiphila TaxID=715473 RepID=A0A558A8A5_9PSEU|nr:hypothetical protein [Amycolatopsis acidiphila]TVT20489.1 hypothetical protein FNH06_20315 [Amycolatopsis acidiphila]UIJ57014.1 hypothetical protein LWP59_22940 [Amycolatopsis acidiphila]GHG53839.1 hypothetical protein GCM10017788_02900 [Amycolatopsis acidiphila]